MQGTPRHVLFKTLHTGSVTLFLAVIDGVMAYVYFYKVADQS